MPNRLCFLPSWLLLFSLVSAEPPQERLAFRFFDTTVGTADTKLSASLPNDLRQRLREANQASTAAWKTITTAEEWQDFRAKRLLDLKNSLGIELHLAEPLRVQRTGELAGEAFVVENLLFSGRAGEWITANLYRPARPAKAMPGLLLSHSHHNPKTEAELQIMGMTWARAGCLVLVIDHVGHGERRQHPFRAAHDFPAAKFRTSRQDYWFRYDVSLQAALAGESLMGLMVQDLLRGVDLLLAQPGIDREKIILLGAVAGGGDPAAVAGALDERIAAVVPFNFGGPQPESPYPLPADAAATFGYAGSGSWEATRNLSDSAAQGFLPWVIVGSIAPRRLVYGHEFSWDRERDPVWQRLETIFAWKDASTHLAFAHGTGRLSGQPPEASHCNNIGAVHRRHIHAAFKEWFGIEVAEDYRKTFSAEQLQCVTADSPKPGLLRERWQAKAAANSSRNWKQSFPSLEPREVRVLTKVVDHDAAGEKYLLAAEVPIPLVLFRPRSVHRPPVVVCVAQQGKRSFFQAYADKIFGLKQQGIAVCLVDVRGTGETAVDGERDRTSYATSLSASEQMLGSTLLEQQVRDLRTVLAFLRADDHLDGRRIALWGESFAPPNDSQTVLAVPHGVERPTEVEPLGGMVVMLTALYEPKLKGVAVHRGLASYASAFAEPCVYLPHDSILPGAVPAGDVAGLATEIAPIPLRMSALTDAQNRAVSLGSTHKIFAEALKVPGEWFSLNLPKDNDLVAWFEKRLR